jgi:hypothetical protein
MEIKGALVELHGHVVVAPHLVLIGLFEEFPGGLEFFNAHVGFLPDNPW